MKFIRFKNPVHPSQLITGVDCGDGSALPLAGSVFDPLEPIGEPIAFAEADLVAPFEPRVIMGIGMNYRGHAVEQGKELPVRPMMFMKNINAVTGPFAEIVIPQIAQAIEQTDYECELAIVIGKAAKNVGVENALDYILGYTAANDVSARWWQKTAGGGQFNRGKSFDTYCPIGPCIVTLDELTNPDALELSTKLNGSLMQSGNTAEMIFSVAELVAFLSEGTTLVPGTLILTGTPAGVGFARQPPIFLQAGDLVEVTVAGIGTLRNPVRVE